jgi:O-methyltransferase
MDDQHLSPADLYVDLLQRAVRNEFYREPVEQADMARAQQHLASMQPLFGAAIERVKLTPEQLCDVWRRNRPPAHTLSDQVEMGSLRQCIETVLRERIPGDFIEAGVYRGGQVVFMRGVLAAHGVRDRRVFVADSFQGLPPRDLGRDPDDAFALAVLDGIGRFSVSLQDVQATFARYGLLDEQVVFLEGWFSETLPSAPIESLALMSVDANFYESTWDAFNHLYPRLVSGGFAIIEDYGLPVIGCRRAVDEFRARHGIEAPIQWVNHLTAYWRKP